MLKKSVIGCMGILLLAGCAGQTTDPRKGGLFSYDPKAYDQRLADRRSYLSSVENDTTVQKKKNSQLKYEKSKLK